MSFMDSKNILTEAQIDNILKQLSNSGRRDIVDKARSDKTMQKQLIKLQQVVDKSNAINVRIGKRTGKQYKKLTIADYF